jgi:hypothetical protein
MEEIKQMDSIMLKTLARKAGMVEGPWANGAKERIWQENRDFPDALEVFASLIVKECVKAIDNEIIIQSNVSISPKIITKDYFFKAIDDKVVMLPSNIDIAPNIIGLYQAKQSILAHFLVDIDTESV